MWPLVLALVISVGPDNELNRTEILEVMTTRPTGECGVGNPWVDFVNRDRAPETNALLMTMSSDVKLSDEQRGFALEALITQKKDHAVVDFFRRAFVTAQPRTSVRRQAATFLLEASEPDRASVLKQFDTGDLALDRDVLHWLQLAHETLIIPPATVARLRALYEQAPAETDDVVKISFGAGWAASRRAMEQRRANAPLNKRELIAPLVRLAPQTYVPVVLRSKDPAEIGYAYGHVEFASADDLIEGLASANETMRERLDDALARLIKSTLTVAERKALTQEVLSSKKRAGLSRISLAAYTLGTAAESQRDFASAQKLYALASANPDFGSAARAQRVGLLMKQQKTAEAKALAQGLMTALRDSHDGFTVLENDSLIDNSGLTTLIMKFDRASGN